MMNIDNKKIEPAILQYSTRQKLVSFIIAFSMMSFFCWLFIAPLLTDFSIWSLLGGILMSLIGPFFFLLKWTEKLYLYSDRIEHTLMWSKNEILFFNEFDRFRVTCGRGDAKIEFTNTGENAMAKTLHTNLNKKLTYDLIDHLVHSGLINAFVEEQEELYESTYNYAISDESLGNSEDQRLDSYNRYVTILNWVIKSFQFVFYGLLLFSVFNSFVRTIALGVVVLTPPLLYLIVPKSFLGSKLPALKSMVDFSYVLIIICLSIMMALSVNGLLVLIKIKSYVIVGLFLSFISFIAFNKKFNHAITDEQFDKKIHRGKVIGFLICSLMYGFSSITVAMLIGR